ncbi:hypothetical protein [Photobacterium damselae]|uniref:Uncharacterized protein n=1 Tax=Photobacterium damselae TaxID=38293 RepID=A0A2X1XWJ0_PHODM|nr:hypothetical protein [Photobacterium damselae]SPY45134.1 Uncharacterised protein [Photobacterium damselae]
MRIPEQVILSALQKGACIKTFYRASPGLAGSTARRIPDGYVLESPGERNEVILSHTDFQPVENGLQKEKPGSKPWKVYFYGPSLRKGSEKNK